MINLNLVRKRNRKKKGYTPDCNTPLDTILFFKKVAIYYSGFTLLPSKYLSESL